MKVSIIMPVFNEKDTLPLILEKIKKVKMEKEIIIVDDCSVDGTKEILKRIDDPRVRIIYHSENKGKGAAIRTAQEYFKGEVVIIQDADLEYNPEDYLKLIKPLEEGSARVVYGSRFLYSGNTFTPRNYWGNKLLTWLTNVLYRANLTDMETCYKAFHREVFKKLHIKANRFEFEPEVTAKILKLRIKIIEVPISYYGRGYKQGKKITWKDGFIAMWTLIKYRFIN